MVFLSGMLRIVGGQIGAKMGFSASCVVKTNAELKKVALCYMSNDIFVIFKLVSEVIIIC